MPGTEDGSVGICVSGGGLRSASFGLGVLQALQHRLGLLRGERAADFLSAVSGGSYIAGAYTLVNCSDRLTRAGGGDHGAAIGRNDAPFAPASPEAAHLRRHCRYMVEDGGLRTSLRFAALSLLNLLTVTSLVVWFGVMPIGDVAVVASWVLPAAVDSPDGWPWLQWLLAAVGVVMLVALVSATKSSPSGSRWWSVLRMLILLPIYAAAMAALVARAQTIPELRSPAWVLDHALAIAAGIATTTLVTAVALSASRRVPFGGVALR